MAPQKRKNTYKNEYEKEFQGIKRSKKGDEYAHCIPCDEEICLTSIGKTAISIHQQKEKHKKAAKAANLTKAITSFLPSTSAPTKMDHQVAAAEGYLFLIQLFQKFITGTIAYHLARHAQSFRSADWSDLLQKICPDSKIAEKFASHKTKTTAIINGIYILKE